MKQIDPTALFRLSVLGPLVSRERLEPGELQRTLRELARREYAIPNSRRTYLGEKTIESWLYKYRREGIDGMAPKTRVDRGRSKIAPALQEAIVAAKRDNPRRSIRQIRQLLQASGQAAKNSLSRSAIHRLLAGHGIARMSGSSSEPEEKRSFVAESAGAIWYGDVMHGPRVVVDGKPRKVYLVSLFDDASRLVTHSAFCLGETALDIEGVLKQALLKRGRPIKLDVDNGAAYRAGTLQALCARLGIHVIYCRPYQPTSKGKLERWHRTVRDQFNPHRYQVIYQPETDFGRLDLYRSLAGALGVEPSYRRAQLWRDIKQRILEMVDGKQVLPVWIIDEAQNLPVEFFRDLPAFLNFAFDSRDLISVWLVRHPGLAQTLKRAPYAALHGRIAARVQLRPVVERERFALLVGHALKTAGCQHTLLADSGMEVLRQASKGLPRMAGRILRTAMRLAVPKGLNDLPDDLLQQAIEELR